MKYFNKNDRPTSTDVQALIDEKYYPISRGRSYVWYKRHWRLLRSSQALDQILPYNIVNETKVSVQIKMIP